MNNFVSAALDTDVASKAVVLINRVSRGDGEASFSETCIAARVCRLVVVSTMITDMDERDGEFFVRGKRALRHGSSKWGLQTRKVTEKRVWLPLDKAGRRAAVFPYVLGISLHEKCRLDCSELPGSDFTNPIIAAQHAFAALKNSASNSGCETSIGSTKYYSRGAAGVVLFFRHRGYPLRCG